MTLCLFRRLSLRVDSGVARLVFAFQCMSYGHESHWDTIFIFFLKSSNLGNSCKVGSEQEYMVSGWRFVEAVLLKVAESLTCTYTYKAQHTPRLRMYYCFVPKD